MICLIPLLLFAGCEDQTPSPERIARIAEQERLRLTEEQKWIGKYEFFEVLDNGSLARPILLTLGEGEAVKIHSHQKRWKLRAGTYFADIFYPESGHMEGGWRYEENKVVFLFNYIVVPTIPPKIFEFECSEGTLYDLQNERFLQSTEEFQAKETPHPRGAMFKIRQIR